MRNSKSLNQDWARAGALGAALLVLALLVACSGAAATPSVTVGPTLQAAATRALPTAAAAGAQAASTVQAVSTQAAPTARAVSTQAAPTLQAVATQAAPVAATVSASAPIRVMNVNVGSSDASVAVQNVGSQAVDLSRWSLQVGAARTQLPAGVDVAPGQTVNLHTAPGTSTSTDVYLGSDANAVANELRPGTQVVLANPSGSPVSSFVVPNG